MMEKIHNNRQDKALTKVIKNIPGVDNYFIQEDILFIEMDREKLNKRDAAQFHLPSLNEIKSNASKVYKKFENNEIKELIYLFKSITFNGKVVIESPYATLRFVDCHIYANIDIKNADVVEMFENFHCYHTKTFIKANKILLERNVNLNHFKVSTETKFNLFSDYIEINDFGVYNCSEILLFSDIISLVDSSLHSDTIIINSHLIDTKNSNLKANKEIKINSDYNDEVKGVYAPKIIYNGVDVTCSENIVRPKLMESLLKQLKELRDITSKMIDEDVKEAARICKLKSEEKPIEKVLNRKNT